MNEAIFLMAEKKYGIKPDPDDVEKLKKYLLDNSKNNSNSNNLLTDDKYFEHFFISGKAATFLTVNETYFFREPLHFFLLLDILPALNRQSLRICSAATSSGCEAYSIAMLLDTYNKTAENKFSYHIDAFDINPNVIETAKNGVYGTRTLREDGNCFNYISDYYLEKNDNKIIVKQELKNNINFFVHNVLNEFKFDYYDIIFFRNAFIYFLPDYREKVLINLSDSLKENGFLITGISETSNVKNKHLEQKINRLHLQNEEVFFFQKNSNQKPAGQSHPNGKDIELSDYFNNTLPKKSAV